MKRSSTSTNSLKFLWITFAIFLIDIATKFVVISHYSLYQSLAMLPFFSITYVRNYGAAFGLFLGQRWPLAIMALVISAFIVRFLYKTSKTDYLNNIGFSLVLGGALGNLFDRLYHGYVIDFFDFYINNWHYPAFNVADSAICIGVTMLLIGCFSGQKTREKNKGDQ